MSKKCLHLEIEYSQPYIGAWCETPRYKCVSCGIHIEKDTELQKGTVFNPKKDGAVLKRSGKFGELTDSDLSWNNGPQKSKSKSKKIHVSAS